MLQQMSDLGWDGDAQAWRELLANEHPSDIASYIPEIQQQLFEMNRQIEADHPDYPDPRIGNAFPEQINSQSPQMPAPQVAPCPNCGNENMSLMGVCPKCGMQLNTQTQQNPGGSPVLQQAFSAIKQSQLPDEAQSTIQPGQGMSPTQAPNPAMQGDMPTPAPVGDENKALSDPKAMARITVANEQAAKNFSVLSNLDNASEIKAKIAEQYGLPEEYLDSNLLIEAKFGDTIALNGEIKNEGVDTQTYGEVQLNQQPEPQEGMGDPTQSPESSLHEIKKGATVPLKLIIQKIMKDQNMDEVTAINSLKDSWAGQDPPLSMNVLVQGSLKYYLPKEALGEQAAPTPFSPPQLPEDVMDQDYNVVPTLPSH